MSKAIKHSVYPIAQELEMLGYKRIDYNGGDIVAYMKAFNNVNDPQDYDAMRIEVRFGEYPDMPLQTYIVTSMHILPLRELRAVEDIEALYQLLARGRGKRTPRRELA